MGLLYLYLEALALLLPDSPKYTTRFFQAIRRTQKFEIVVIVKCFGYDSAQPVYHI
jgi:hypothetical protein